MENKSILVIETPTNCYECPLIYWGNIGGWNCKPTRALLDDANGKPEWCPLRPMPQKKDIDKTLEFGGYENIIQESLARGYNACLEEITK